MITSKRNSIVLWHFFGFNSRRYEVLMSVWFTVIKFTQQWYTSKFATATSLV